MYLGVYINQNSLCERIALLLMERKEEKKNPSYLEGLTNRVVTFGNVYTNMST